MQTIVMLYILTLFKKYCFIIEENYDAHNIIRNITWIDLLENLEVNILAKKHKKCILVI